MLVEFTRHDEKGRLACSWTAVRGKRTQVPGAYMPAGRDLPHDLAQYVVEAATGTTHGFWGLIASGATFRSTGRKATQQGRAIIAAHRDDLDDAEVVANTHLLAWRRGDTTEVTAALDAALAQWRALASDEVIAFRWPSPTGIVRPAGGATA